MNINYNQLIESSLPKLKNYQNIGDIVSIIVSTYLFPAAGIVLFFFIIFGGYEIMFSAGDPKKVAAGKGRITSAIIGFIIMFVSYWLVQGIALALGLESINALFKS